MSNAQITPEHDPNVRAQWQRSKGAVYYGGITLAAIEQVDVATANPFTEWPISNKTHWELRDEPLKGFVSLTDRLREACTSAASNLVDPERITPSLRQDLIDHTFYGRRRGFDIVRAARENLTDGFMDGYGMTTNLLYQAYLLDSQTSFYTLREASEDLQSDWMQDLIMESGLTHMRLWGSNAEEFRYAIKWGEAAISLAAGTEVDPAFERLEDGSHGIRYTKEAKQGLRSFMAQKNNRAREIADPLGPDDMTSSGCPIRHNDIDLSGDPQGINDLEIAFKGTPMEKYVGEHVRFERPPIVEFTRLVGRKLGVVADHFDQEA
ncbi:MAG: hypothetical protein M3P98_01890 [bacterium]|nr:hypothetical protein [bacterium]